MQISYNWLTELVKLPKEVTPAKLAQALTMATVEVEAVVDQAAALANIVVGEVRELKKHPNADQLQLAIVDIGKKDLVQIVCGGTNLFVGMKVALALPGARVRWHGQGEWVAIQATAIRGEQSFGMICASTEIGLGEVFPNQPNEILNISFCDGQPGDSLAAALNLQDTILEIDNKSLTNRPDLWCHYGLAREVAAIYQTEMKQLATEKISTGKSRQLKISLKSAASRRYLGAVVDNIEIKDSPRWLQQRLIAAGLRPINNIVDLTNYVMLEVGEPMHAFDYDQIANGTIVIRAANDKETLLVLGEEKLRLSKDVLVIADSKQAVALAGIKGGALTGITASTRKIILEAANFDPVSIRRTANKYDYRTDASQRHEKSLDVERAELGMGRLLYLLKEILPTAQVDTVVAAGSTVTAKVEVKTTVDYIGSRLGLTLPGKEIAASLARLGFQVKVKDKNLTIQVPSWRATGDVTMPADIVEEVGRLYGYDNLPGQPLNLALTKAVYQPAYQQERKTKEYLSGPAGWQEVDNYPWTSSSFLSALSIPVDKSLQLANPPTPETAYLQTSLLPNLLSVLEKNLNNFDQFGYFELARVFYPQYQRRAKEIDHLPVQPQHLAGVLLAGRETALLQVKGAISGLFAQLAKPAPVFQIVNNYDYLDRQQQLEIWLTDQFLGQLGVVSEVVVRQLGWKLSARQVVVAWEIDFSQLIKQPLVSRTYQPWPEFPTVERDLAFVFDYQVSWAELEKLVSQISPLVSQVEYLSTYDLAGKKSLAFRIKYGALDRTLTSAEVEQAEKKIISKLQTELHGELRK